MVCTSVISSFIFLTFRSLRKWLKAQPKEVRRKYYKLLALKLAVLFGGFGAFSSYNYYKHEQEAPITHRKRYISLTPEQYLKIAEVESQEVSTWPDRSKLMTSLVSEALYFQMYYMQLQNHCHFRVKKCKELLIKTCHFYAPPQKVAGYYVIPSELLSVCPSLCLSVHPSVSG